VVRHDLQQRLIDAVDGHAQLGQTAEQLLEACGFRRKTNTRFGATRTVISVEAEH
jgi:hypothetical protein